MSLAADVVEAEAGATTPVGLTVVNRGETTDRFEVEVEGIDPEWRFIPVPTFAVEPGETRNEKVFLKPPRLPESVAGAYPFVVRVRSLESGETRTAQAMLKLGAFHHLTIEIAPKKGVVSPTTKRNDFRLTLVNLGNSEHTLQLSAQDPEERCAYEFESDQVVLAPGQQREVEMVADPKQAPILSSGRLIGFSVFARSLNERNVTATAQAQLEQRSLLSPATLVAFVLLLGILGTWWAMRPVPPSVHLSVSPPHALPGEQIQLRVTAEHADHIKVTMGSSPDETLVYEGPLVNEPIVTELKGKSGDTVTFFAEATREGRPSDAHESKTVLVDTPPVVPQVAIDKFYTETNRVKIDTPFVVHWKVQNAIKVAVTPVADDLSPELESQEITPRKLGEQEYTLVAFGTDGKSVKKTISVQVYDESEARILAFGADPTTAKEEEGGKTTLSWQVTGAERVELSVGGAGPDKVDPTGSQEFTITGKTLFVLTAIDIKGRKTSKTVKVLFEKPVIVINPPVDPPTTDPNFPDKIPPPTTGP